MWENLLSQFLDQGAQLYYQVAVKTSLLIYCFFIQKQAVDADTLSQFLLLFEAEKLE